MIFIEYHYQSLLLSNEHFHLDTPTGTPLGSEEDLAPTPPLSSKTRSNLQPDDFPRIQGDRKELTRRRSNELGNRGPPPDVTIPQGDSSNFGMNTRRSVHMSSVRAKRNEGSGLFIYQNRYSNVFFVNISSLEVLKTNLISTAARSNVAVISNPNSHMIT